MCGEDLPFSAYTDRFGALAVLRPLPDAYQRSDTDTNSLGGSIVFFNDSDHGCQVATHVRFSPSEPLALAHRRSLFVDIHDLGDLRMLRPHADATSDAISLCCPVDDAGLPDAPILRRLSRPLHLHVGHDQKGNKGIIGRRIAVFCLAPGEAQGASRVLAEGIVGYNSCPRPASPA